MALSRTDLLGQISGTSGTFGAGAFTTNAFTPPNNSLLVVAVAAIENGGSTTLLTDLTLSSSPSLTFTARVEEDASVTGFSTGVRVWTAPITTGASTTLTVDCGTRSIGMYAVSVVAATGYNTSSPIGATGSAFLDTSIPGPPTPASLTLDAAPAATSGILGVAGIDKSVAGVTPGIDYTEIHEVHNTDWGGLESEFRTTGSTSTAVDWVDLRSGGGALFNYAVVGLEIKEAVGAVPGPPPFFLPPGRIAPCGEQVAWTGTDAQALVVFTVALSGSVAPSADLTRQSQAVKAGAIAPVGAITKQPQQLLTGQVPTSGSVLKLVGKLLAGSTTPPGSLATIRTRVIDLAGTISPAGSLVRQAAKLLTGAASPAGMATKQAGVVFAGGATPTGALVTIRTRLLALAGAIAPAGTATKRVEILREGSVSPAASMVKNTAKSLSGAASPSGALLKLLGRLLAGTVNPSGSTGFEASTPEQVTRGAMSLADDQGPAMTATDQPGPTMRGA